MDNSLDYDFIQKIRDGELDVISWLAAQDENSIRNRIYARVPADIDTSVGSYEYDAIEPSTIEFAVQYFMLRNIIFMAYPQHAFGEWLTLAAEARGVYRNAAKYATGKLLISGTAGTKIPKGTKFSNVIPQGSTIKTKYYSTTEVAVIPEEGKIEIPIIADEAGTAGNAFANEITLNIESVKNITSVTNENALTTGVDEEKDESLLSRLLEVARNQSASGNKKSYVIWAKEVSGVTEVDVIPLWNGPGTVKVIIVGDGGKPVPELISEVKEHLDPSDHEGEGEGRAPIGAVVTVTTVENLVINVYIEKVELSPGYEPEAAKVNIKMALATYISSVGIGGIVRLRAAEDSVKHANGVIDFGSVTLNGEEKNIQVAAHLKPILGEVSIGGYA